VKDSSVIKTTWTFADASSGQDLQGSSVTLAGGRTACMTSVNEMAHQLISRNILWLLKSYVRLGIFPRTEGVCFQFLATNLTFHATVLQGKWQCSVREQFLFQFPHPATADFFSTPSATQNYVFACSSEMKLQKPSFAGFMRTSFVNAVCGKAI
jgi:hypothetical protein